MAPRVVATMFVALMINGIVIGAGIGGGYFFTVIIQVGDDSWKWLLVGPVVGQRSSAQ